MPTTLEEEQLLGFLRPRSLRATAEGRTLLREIFAQHGPFEADSIVAAVHRRGLARRVKQGPELHV